MCQDAILIETTGLADPAPVIQTFFMDEGIKAKAKIDAVLFLSIFLLFFFMDEGIKGQGQDRRGDRHIGNYFLCRKLLLTGDQGRGRDRRVDTHTLSVCLSLSLEH